MKPIICAISTCDTDVSRSYELIPHPRKRKNAMYMVCRFHYKDYMERNKDA